MSQFLHRIRSKIFPPSELDGKTLRYFLRERSHEYTMRVQDPFPDGSFILLVADAELKDVSLDQRTVDQIERAGTSSRLSGAAFVVFDQSPQSRALCQ